MEYRLRTLALPAPAATGLVFAGIAGFLMPPEPRAHCSEQFSPVTSLSRPADGVAVETVCWPVLQECFVDTFYREELLRELAAGAAARKHAAFLYVDSVANRLGFDTVRYMGEIQYIDTLQEEEVWISVHADLMGNLPGNPKGSRYRFLDRFIYVAGNPFATTYTALLDTPILAFFDAMDTLKHMGLGPLDGCFFEPTAYLVREGRILKRSADESRRMPGVDVAAADFFRAAGLAPVDLPPVRPRHVGVRRGRAPWALPARGRPGMPCDLNGRRLPARIRGETTGGR